MEGRVKKSRPSPNAVVAPQYNDILGRHVLDNIVRNHSAQDIIKMKMLSLPALLVFASSGHMEGLTKLMDGGADVNVKSPLMLTALHLAARQGHVTVCQKLLEAGADMKSANQDGDNAFMWAVSHGKTDIVNLMAKYFNQNGFDINHANQRGCTVLHLAAERCWGGCVKMLLSTGSIKKDLTNEYGLTALMIAAKQGDKPTVQALAEGGANLLSENKYCNTAICLAIVQEKHGVSDFLLDQLSEERRMGFVKRRFRVMHVLPEETQSEGLKSSVVYHTLCYLARKEPYRAVMLSLDCVEPWLQRMKDHMHSEKDTAAGLCALSDFLCGPGPSKVDPQVLQQFLKCNGPEFMLDILRRHKHNLGGVSMVPLLALAASAEGSAWLEQHCQELVGFAQTFKAMQYNVPGHLQDMMKPVWKQFSDLFETITKAQCERHCAELLAGEEREKVKRERRREKKRQKRQLQRARDAALRSCVLPSKQAEHRADEQGSDDWVNSEDEEGKDAAEEYSVIGDANVYSILQINQSPNTTQASNPLPEADIILVENRAQDGHIENKPSQSTEGNQNSNLEEDTNQRLHPRYAEPVLNLDDTTDTEEPVASGRPPTPDRWDEDFPSAMIPDNSITDPQTGGELSTSEAEETHNNFSTNQNNNLENASKGVDDNTQAGEVNKSLENENIRSNAPPAADTGGPGFCAWPWFKAPGYVQSIFGANHQPTLNDITRNEIDGHNKRWADLVKPGARTFSSILRNFGHHLSPSRSIGKEPFEADIDQVSCSSDVSMNRSSPHSSEYAYDSTPGETANKSKEKTDAECSLNHSRDNIYGVNNSTTQAHVDSSDIAENMFDRNLQMETRPQIMPGANMFVTEGNQSNHGITNGASENSSEHECAAKPPPRTPPFLNTSEFSFTYRDSCESYTSLGGDSSGVMNLSSPRNIIKPPPGFENEYSTILDIIRERQGSGVEMPHNASGLADPDESCDISFGFFSCPIATSSPVRDEESSNSVSHSLLDLSLVHSQGLSQSTSSIALHSSRSSHSVDESHGADDTDNRSFLMMSSDINMMPGLDVTRDLGMESTGDSSVVSGGDLSRAYPSSPWTESVSYPEIKSEGDMGIESENVVRGSKLLDLHHFRPSLDTSLEYGSLSPDSGRDFDVWEHLGFKSPARGRRSWSSHGDNLTALVDAQVQLMENYKRTLNPLGCLTPGGQGDCQHQPISPLQFPSGRTPAFSDVWRSSLFPLQVPDCQTNCDIDESLAAFWLPAFLRPDIKPSTPPRPRRPVLAHRKTRPNNNDQGKPEQTQINWKAEVNTSGMQAGKPQTEVIYGREINTTRELNEFGGKTNDSSQNSNKDATIGAERYVTPARKQAQNGNANRNEIGTFQVLEANEMNDKDIDQNHVTNKGNGTDKLQTNLANGGQFPEMLQDHCGQKYNERQASTFPTNPKATGNGNEILKINAAEDREQSKRCPNGTPIHDKKKCVPDYSTNDNEHERFEALKMHSAKQGKKIEILKKPAAKNGNNRQDLNNNFTTDAMIPERSPDNKLEKVDENEILETRFPIERNHYQPLQTKYDKNPHVHELRLDLSSGKKGMDILSDRLSGKQGNKRKMTECDTKLSQHNVDSTRHWQQTMDTIQENVVDETSGQYADASIAESRLGQRKTILRHCQREAEQLEKSYGKPQPGPQQVTRHPSGFTSHAFRNSHSPLTDPGTTEECEVAEGKSKPSSLYASSHHQNRNTTRYLEKKLDVSERNQESALKAVQQRYEVQYNKPPQAPALPTEVLSRLFPDQQKRTVEEYSEGGDHLADDSSREDGETTVPESRLWSEGDGIQESLQSTAPPYLRGDAVQESWAQASAFAGSASMQRATPHPTLPLAMEPQKAPNTEGVVGPAGGPAVVHQVLQPAGTDSKHPILWVPRSCTWSAMLNRLASLPMQWTEPGLGPVIMARNSKPFAIAQGPSGGMINLGFLRDGSEVAVKQVSLKRLEIIQRTLVSLQNTPLQHENLLPYKLLLNRGTLGLAVMELCECNLCVYMLHHRTVMRHDIISCLFLAVQILRGLAFLHTRGVPHRNLKPTNVLVDARHHLRLADFGVPPDPQAHVYFPEYKFWQDSEIYISDSGEDPRQIPFKSDVKVAGMLLYYLLTCGEHPYGRTAFDIQVNRSVGRLATRALFDEADGLINAMMTTPHKNRPAAQETLRHPLFWDDDVKLQFLVTVVQEALGMDHNRDVPSREICARINNGLDANSWLLFMPGALVQEVAQLSGYTYKSNTADLLALMGHTAIALPVLSESTRRLLGEKVSTYFLSRFPKILMHVYNIVRDAIPPNQRSPALASFY